MISDYTCDLHDPRKEGWLHSENGKKGAQISSLRNVELGKGIHGLSTSQRSENGRKGGKKGGKRLVEEGRSPFQQLVTCPYCGKMGNKGNMHRWHFEKCFSQLD